jgi:Flp pilus assembly pilin Flp
MLQYLNQKRGQSTLEYAVLIVVIIGALLTIQTYIKRGVQGRLKSAADDIGDQYSDGNTNMIKSTVRNSSTEEYFNQGASSSNMINAELTNTTMNSVIVNSAQEYWGQ